VCTRAAHHHTPQHMRAGSTQSGRHQTHTHTGSVSEVRQQGAHVSRVTCAPCCRTKDRSHYKTGVITSERQQSSVCLQTNSGWEGK
jgi:hypothetical protein